MFQLPRSSQMHHHSLNPAPLKPFSEGPNKSDWMFTRTIYGLFFCLFDPILLRSILVPSCIQVFLIDFNGDHSVSSFRRKKMVSNFGRKK